MFAFDLKGAADCSRNLQAQLERIVKLRCNLEKVRRRYFWVTRARHADILVQSNPVITETIGTRKSVRITGYPY